MVYAGTEVGVFRSEDAGSSWTRTNSGLLPRQVKSFAIDPKSPSTLYVATPFGVYITEDRGSNWISRSAGLPIDANLPAPNPPEILTSVIALDPVAPSTLYVGLLYHGVYKSTDQGKKWISSNS